MRDLGLAATVLHRKISFDRDAGDAGAVSATSWLGESSPEDLMRLAALIGTGEAVSARASAGMLAILKRQHSRIQFPRFFGYNPFAPELGLEQQYWVANKTGSVPGVRADTGLVGLPGGQTIAFGVMTEGCQDTGFTSENEGEIANGIAGRILLEHWWPEGFAAGHIGLDSPHLTPYQ
jgi:beta-lactamase class A